MIFKFSSECVGCGHPDKVCDAIADAILDEALKQDPHSFMAVEATIKDNFVLIYGEANSKATLDYASIAKETLKKAGYDQIFDIMVKVGQQSCQINHAVTNGEIAAGDQGMMFGYACNETDAYLPYGYLLACQLAEKCNELAFGKYKNVLQTDCKTQVTVRYEDGRLIDIDTILVSVASYEGIEQAAIDAIVKNELILPLVSNHSCFNENTKLIINPSGAFTIAGPFGDSGTTGRKIVVDTYGGYAPIGGGCFSSKDPSKVDRSAAYYSRFVAKNIVANGLADKALIQVAYGIGLSKPISLCIDCYGSNKIEMEAIYQWVANHFDFSVGNIIEQLQLRLPIYSQCVNYGAFTHENMAWEKVILIK